jgi:hypothetical protein
MIQPVDSKTVLKEYKKCAARENNGKKNPAWDNLSILCWAIL